MVKYNFDLTMVKLEYTPARYTDTAYRQLNEI